MFIGIIATVFVLGLIVFAGSRLINFRGNEITHETTHSSQVTNSTGSFSDNTEEVEAPIEDAAQLKNFLELYFSWDLTDESVDERVARLEEMINPNCFESLNIVSDSQTLKEMIATYEETKEINTSNSTQLLSSRYLSSEIYQDTADRMIFYVEVRYEQKAPYQDDAYITKESYRIILENGRVSEIQQSNS